MHRPVRPRLALAVGALLAFGAAACGSDGTASPSSTAQATTSSASGATSSAGGTQATSSAAPAVTSERIRIVAALAPRAAMSPLSDDAFKLARWSIGETLVVLDANGDVKPGLASAWTKVDDRRWRFELRTGVGFHDGTTLDAAAVVNSLTKAAAAAPAPRILDGVGLTAEVDPTNAAAVVVSTAAPDPLLVQRLSSPQLSILAASAYKPDGTVSPVRSATGPFVLQELNGTTGAKIDRFDGYWGTKAAAPGIDVQFVPDATARAAALRTGAADLVELIPVSQAPNIDASLLVEVKNYRTTSLYLNNETGAFAEAGVRAAARQAIDLAPIVENVYEGRTDAARGIFGPALPWTADRPARTAAAATAVSGKAITLATYSDRAELPEVAVRLEQQLEAAGFDVTQVVREYSKIEADALAGAFDAFILSRGTMIDSGDPVAFLASDFSCAGKNNMAQLCNPAIDAAISAASATPAGPARRTAVLAVEKLVLEADALVPLVHERNLLGQGPRLRNVTHDPLERVQVTVETVAVR